MILSLIAAMDKNRLIGKDNYLPWYLPADLQHFKSITMTKPILMGRKTYDSIGRPLPGRQNIVLTRGDIEIEGVSVVNSIEQAMAVAGNAEEVMVIGGSSVYELVMPEVQRMYLSFIDGEFEGDAWFPEFDENDWKILDEKTQMPDEKNAYACRFVTYQRR
ncbi:MAG: type 3 dihydrofolate reductase [Gammaproteobacteria bacterium]|nr:type 3 dihydrofolate reductase [Gammaproteobacteria bacterium]